MEWTRRRFLAIGIGLLVARAGLRGQGAAPATPAVTGPAARESLLRSHGDDRAVRVGDELAGFRAVNQGLVGGVARRPVDFAGALAKARALAQAAGGEAVLAPVRAAAPGLSTLGLRGLAAREVVKGNPTGALVVLVATLDRAPDDPEVLVDLAGVLAMLGHANEALAIFDELARRGAWPASVMGLAGRDAVEYGRGYCLVRLGEVDAARLGLAAVAERQPSLAEASRLLALVAKDEAEARKHFLLGVWRHRGSLMVCAGVDPAKAEPDPWVAGDEVAIDYRTLIESGRGELGRLPDIPYVSTVLQANGIIPVLERRVLEDEAREKAVSAARKKPKGFIHPETGVEETWGHRMYGLFGSLEYRDRKLRELDRVRREVHRETAAALDAIDEEKRKSAADAMSRLRRARLDAKGPDPTPGELGEVLRPFHEAAMTRSRPLLARREKAERDWFGEWHRLAGAVTSRVGDRAWHLYLSQTIEIKRHQAYQRLLDLALTQARMGRHRYVTAEPGEAGRGPEAQPPEACDDAASIGISTDDLAGEEVVPFEFGVELTCKGISAELAIDTRIPGLSVSTEAAIDNQGAYTVFMGPKAEVTAGPKAIAEFAGTAKLGGYLSGNRRQVTEAGVKYEVKVGTKLGSASSMRQVAGDTLVRIVPAPEEASGAFEPLRITVKPR